MSTQIDGGFKAVLFDLYGTLVDCSAQNYLDSVSEMRHTLGALIEWEARFRELIVEMEFGRLTVAQAVRQAAFGHEASQDLVDEAVEIWRRWVCQALDPRPGAVALVRALRSRGLRLGLISNADPIAAALWKRTSMAPHFQASVFSSQVFMRKPNPEIYLHAAGLLGVEPSRCLFIGDGSNCELSGALEAGMAAAQIKVAYEDEETVRLLHREEWIGRTVDSFQAILTLLELQCC